MSRIITNVPSQIAQRILTQTNKGLNATLERLSTGFRINRGADDPAGLIASENLRAEKVALSSAIGNAERADQVINIAEGGLTEVSNLLTELEGLVDVSANKAGLSTEEKEANQLQIDSILQTIDRIANSTSFQGTKLLNGTFDYQLTGHNTAQLDEVVVNAAKIPTGSTIGVQVDVTASARTAVVFLSSGATLNNSGSGSLTIEVAGNGGSQQFTFASGVAIASLATAINNFKNVTGVSASVSGAILKFNSQKFGSSQFASVTKLVGTTGIVADVYAANSTATTARDTGRDATIRINGTTATTDGLTARVASASLDVEVTLDTAINTDSGSSSFTVSGGGATFSLAPKLDLAGRASIGVGSVTTGNLGSLTNGRLSALTAGGAANVTNGNTDTAQLIVRDAISQVSSLRGRLGAFQKNTIGATIRSLGVALENTSAAESQIRDTDFAKDTAALTRAQILQSASTNVLAIANSAPQSVLRLLG